MTTSQTVQQLSRRQGQTNIYPQTDTIENSTTFAKLLSLLKTSQSVKPRRDVRQSNDGRQDYWLQAASQIGACIRRAVRAANRYRAGAIIMSLGRSVSSHPPCISGRPHLSLTVYLRRSATRFFQRPVAEDARLYDSMGLALMLRVKRNGIHHAAGWCPAHVQYQTNNLRASLLDITGDNRWDIVIGRLRLLLCL